MAVENLDGLVKAMGQGKVTLFTRSSVSTMVAGHLASLWRGTGFPATGAIPGAAAICTNALLGAFPLPARTALQDRVLVQAQLQQSAVGHTLILEDRLMHMGGLSGTLTTAQTVNINLHTNIANNNLAERIGSSDYSEVQWYLDWYAATGSTASTPTAQCTFHDGTTGNVNIYALGATALPASVAINRRYQLNPTNGKFIRSVESVTLSASTGTAGSFGVTAVRPRAMMTCVIANQMNVLDWSMLGAPKIFDESGFTLSQVCITTTSGTSNGNIIIGVA